MLSKKLLFKKYVFAAFVLLSLGNLNAQESYWEVVKEEINTSGERWIEPLEYATFSLDEESLNTSLKDAPMEFSEGYKDQLVPIQIPMPNGNTQTFMVCESPVMAPELAARYPQIKTWAGRSLEEPSASIRFDLTPKGFHGMILRVGSPVLIDPMTNENTGFYQVYYKKNHLPENKNFICNVEDHLISELPVDLTMQALGTGNELRNYRLAVATTVEYALFHGGTVASALAAVTTSVNRVIGIYRKEVAITMTLIANNDLIIYTGNPGLDPYTNNNAGSLINENQNNLITVIGVENFDIGHVFSTSAGGLAAPDAVCNNGLKAAGVTGITAPVGDAFDVDYVCHEIGHQFGANHTFNGLQGECGGLGGLIPTSAFEPGSGSTIMGYAGLCGTHNIQFNSDPYFHTRSFQQITLYSSVGLGNDCAEVMPIVNSEPDVNTGSDNFYIPVNTPFELIAEGTDADGDALTYCWEQYNLGPSGSPNNPTGSAPMFRSFSPTTSPIRTFPKQEVLLDGGLNSLGEVMPSYSRALTFRCTIRDNVADAGGVSFDVKEFDVSSNAGPFEVNTPEDDTWYIGQTKGTNWNVANTDQSPVNCDFVDIYLSLDGGETWPIVVEENVPNDGNEIFSVPVYVTDSARLKIKCSNNIFFAINPSMFSIRMPEVSIEVSENETMCLNDELIIPISIDTESNINGVNVSVTTDADVAVDIGTNQVNLPEVLELKINTGSSVNSTNFDVTFSADLDFEVLEQVINITVIDAMLPSSAELSDPSNGTTGAGGSESFSWLPSDGASSYTFTLGTNPNFEDGLLESAADLTENFYTSPTQLEPATVYYWQVSAIAGCSSGTLSEVFSFQTGGGNTSTAVNPQFTGQGNLDVAQGGSETIGSTLLSVDDDNTPGEITYVVVAVPTGGVLQFDGNPLTVGSAFTQEDINNGSLSYLQDWRVEEETDNFVFNISDSNGGWMPNQIFEINVALNVGIEQVKENNGKVRVFPNPSDEQWINFEMPFHSDKPLTIFIQNTSSQTVGEWTQSTNLDGQVKISIEQLPKGIYFYQVQQDGFSDSGKLVIF